MKLAIAAGCAHGCHVRWPVAARGAIPSRRPPGRTWPPACRHLASIGIGPGKRFDFKELSAEHKTAMLLAMEEGGDKVRAYLDSGMKNIDGWKIGSLFGDRAFFHGDFGNPIGRYLINSPCCRA